jgi:hypothetical protein
MKSDILLLDQESSVSINDLIEIDFTMVKLKIQDDEEGLGWTQEECNEIEIEYKKFLALKRAYPQNEIVPNKRVDQFWHQHILDTEKYAQDCQLIFGYFLHHYPYFGMNGEQDKQNLIDAFEETKRLYKKHFKQEYIGEAPKCTTPKCRTACKPMKCR